MDKKKMDKKSTLACSVSTRDPSQVPKQHVAPSSSWAWVISPDFGMDPAASPRSSTVNTKAPVSLTPQRVGRVIRTIRQSQHWWHTTKSRKFRCHTSWVHGILYLWPSWTLCEQDGREWWPRILHRFSPFTCMLHCPIKFHIQNTHSTIKLLVISKWRPHRALKQAKGPSKCRTRGSSPKCRDYHLWSEPSAIQSFIMPSLDTLHLPYLGEKKVYYLFISESYFTHLSFLWRLEICQASRVAEWLSSRALLRRPRVSPVWILGADMAPLIRPLRTIRTLRRLPTCRQLEGPATKIYNCVPGVCGEDKAGKKKKEKKERNLQWWRKWKGSRICWNSVPSFLLSCSFPATEVCFSSISY